jgi:hypothetical protein
MHRQLTHWLPALRMTNPTYAEKTYHQAEICSCTQYSAKAKAKAEGKHLSAREDLCRRADLQNVSYFVPNTNYQMFQLPTTTNHNFCKALVM